jgi:hypothetical protein
VKLIGHPVQTAQARRGRSIPRFAGLTALSMSNRFPGNGLYNFYCASSCLPCTMLGSGPAGRHGPLYPAMGGTGHLPVQEHDKIYLVVVFFSHFYLYELSS